ncbi:hypothetical protein TIFTF001_038203 [Ficus carica]|uniref:Retrotransposon gag domain-containing protein n=1 Tax=Ficus carica TaxID=3494 RepID=A0AA88E6U1_FICCA|nr:hypothetical protein TIFTF001_038203 [Ficus carica]
MANEREHQEEPLQGSPANQPEASASRGNAQIANLMRLVEEFTWKHNTQQNQMGSVSAENQVLKNQLIAINTHAAYSYYDNPYVRYSAGASSGSWQQATPYYPQKVRNMTHSLVAPMQPMSTPGNTPMANERRAQQQQQQPACGSDSMQIFHTLPSTLNDCFTLIECKPRHFDAVFDAQFTTAARRSRVARNDERVVLRWFCNLPPESIDSFDELSLEFMRSYSIHIQSRKTTKDLWGVVQGPHESLRAYIKRFSKAVSEISRLDDVTAREALKKGHRHKSLFKNEIYARYPPTIQDAMHRAKGFIELEEENERFERDLARTREEIAKARVERDHKRPFSPPKYALGISPSELIAHLKRQDFITWPKKLPKNLSRDMTKYCEFHRDHDQHTIDCRKLRAEVAELLNKGHLREFLSEKGRETYELGNESKERKIVQQIEETPSPPLI